MTRREELEFSARSATTVLRESGWAFSTREDAELMLDIFVGLSAGTPEIEYDLWEEDGEWVFRYWWNDEFEDWTEEEIIGV